MTKLNDDSPMPFGKHRGKPMEEVPADYLIWCASKQWVAFQYPAVAEYIEDNWEIINSEDD